MGVVFDAASEFDGMGLNKTLLTGPDLLNKFTRILLLFWNHRVTTAEDCEAT